MDEKLPPNVDGITPLPVPPTSGPSSPTAPPHDPAASAPIAPTKPKKAGSGGRLLMVLLIILLAAIGLFVGYSYGKTKAPTKIVTKTVEPTPITVPEGATVISKCVTGKGTLYALPKDIPTGPVYMVDKNKVVGIEFMVGKDALFTGTNFLNLPLFTQKYDHVNIGLLSQGHAGFPVPHYHVDIYMVSDTVAKTIVCPKT